MADRSPRSRSPRVFLTALLVATALLSLPGPAMADGEPEVIRPHFPKPPALQSNVEFWKRIYTEFGVGDFVLHDRDNLSVIYGVVRVAGTTNQRRAAELAEPQVQLLRAKVEAILSSLAWGVPPEALGSEGHQVDEAWGCPCSPGKLLRAAENIRVQQGLREQVEEGMLRARPLLPRIVSILRRHNVPEEVAALPMVESAFNPAARSKAGAVGLWQFMRSTGRRYLRITRRRDDRRDPILATNAAARLLRHNYEALGSWPLALVAYNHGKGGVAAARDAVGSSAIEEILTRYSGPRFGFASRNFYPEFLAALEVVQPVILQQTQQTEILKRQPRLATRTGPRPMRGVETASLSDQNPADPGHSADGAPPAGTDGPPVGHAAVGHPLDSGESRSDDEPPRYPGADQDEHPQLPADDGL